MFHELGIDRRRILLHLLSTLLDTHPDLLTPNFLLSRRILLIQKLEQLATGSLLKRDRFTDVDLRRVLQTSEANGAVPSGLPVLTSSPSHSDFEWLKGEIFPAGEAVASGEKTERNLEQTVDRILTLFLASSEKKERNSNAEVKAKAYRALEELFAGADPRPRTEGGTETSPISQMRQRRAKEEEPSSSQQEARSAASLFAWGADHVLDWRSPADNFTLLTCAIESQRADIIKDLLLNSERNRRLVLFHQDVPDVLGRIPVLTGVQVGDLGILRLLLEAKCRVDYQNGGAGDAVVGAGPRSSTIGAASNNPIVGGAAAPDTHDIVPVAPNSRPPLSKHEALGPDAGSAQRLEYLKHRLTDADSAAADKLEIRFYQNVDVTNYLSAGANKKRKHAPADIVRYFSLEDEFPGGPRTAFSPDARLSPAKRQQLRQARQRATANQAHVSPLMLAASRGNKEMVTMLLDAGADVGAKSRDGRSARDMVGQALAKLDGSPNTSPTEVDLGAEVNRQQRRQNLLEVLAMLDRARSSARTSARTLGSSLRTGSGGRSASSDPRSRPVLDIGEGEEPVSPDGNGTNAAPGRIRIVQYGSAEPRLRLRKGAASVAGGADETALVDALDPNDPAYKAGVRRGWVLYAIDGVVLQGENYPGRKIGRGFCSLEFRRQRLTLESWKLFAGM